MELGIFFVVGLLLGLKHAFDADHIVAVNTLLAKSKNVYSSILLGTFWGIGHTITLLLSGTVILGIGVVIPQKIALFLEFLVGLMLIILGIGTIHNKLEHFLKKINSVKKSVGIGMIHGLAGSAALMLLLLPKINNGFEGILYIMIFGLGSILGMIIVSILLQVSFSYLNLIKSKSLPKIAGIMSIFLGILIIYEIGFVEGLFLM